MIVWHPPNQSRRGEIEDQVLDHHVLKPYMEDRRKLKTEKPKEWTKNYPPDFSGG
jgi:hypothetical protein